MLRNEVQESNQVSDVAVQDEGMISSDLLVNNLVYRTPSSLSLASERTYTRLFPQTQSGVVNGNTIIFDLTSGTAFHNNYNTYLTFDMVLNVTGATGAAASANFGCGSAMNIIRQVTIKSRSGTELSRVENANVWSRFYHVNYLSKSYLLNQGQVEGWGVNRNAGLDNAVVFGPSGSTGAQVAKFCIPIERLSPFFTPIKKGLKYPSVLMSGLHIEIILEDYRTALVQKSAGGGGTVTGYTLNNIAIMADTTTMTDDTQRAINLEAAQNGLEISYRAIYTSQQSLPALSGNLNMQLRKAVTQANSAMLVFLKQINFTDYSVDSFLSYASDITSFQYRLGSLYFPKQAITAIAASITENPSPTTNFTGQSELYYTTLMTYDKLRNQFDPGAVSLTEYNLYDYSICCSMEKDQSLQLSALPINNSRTLETLITFDTVSAGVKGQRLCFLFLDYAAVCRSFIDNASLSI